MINYIDLFAGAGGLSEGFKSCGYHPVAHVEMNRHACMTLKTRASYYYLKSIGDDNLYRNYLNGYVSRDDLYSKVPDTILNTVINITMRSESMYALHERIKSLMMEQNIKSIDLIVGGPPCQAYSLVGRAVKGKDMIKDPRNYLYELFLQVLAEYKPKMFVFENVPGLLTADKGQYFNTMQRAFYDAGYELDYRILNAKNFAVLQNRQRIILIGWLKKLRMKYPDFPENIAPYTVMKILDDLPSIQTGEENNEYLTSNINEYLEKTSIRKKCDVLTWHVSRPNTDRDREIYRRVIKAWNDSQKRLRYTELPTELCTHNNKSVFLDRFKVVASDISACHTIMAHISKDGHHFIHPDIEQARSITVREAARIQSFPDDFYFEGPRTAAFTQIGNAVPPLMARGIAMELKKLIESHNE